MDGDSVFWTEGGAEYWSDNTGYNWWTASRDQNIRMSVLENRLLEYKEWHTRAGKRGKALPRLPARVCHSLYSSRRFSRTDIRMFWSRLAVHQL